MRNLLILTSFLLISFQQGSLANELTVSVEEASASEEALPERTLETGVAYLNQFLNESKSVFYLFKYVTELSDRKLERAEKRRKPSENVRKVKRAILEKRLVMYSAISPYCGTDGKRIGLNDRWTLYGDLESAYKGLESYEKDCLNNENLESNQIQRMECEKASENYAFLGSCVERFLSNTPYAEFLK